MHCEYSIVNISLDNSQFIITIHQITHYQLPIIYELTRT